MGLGATEGQPEEQDLEREMTTPNDKSEVLL